MGQVFQSAQNLVTNPGQTVGGLVGGGLGGLSKDLTPQNGFQAQTPLDVNNLQQQIYGSQTGLSDVQTNQQALAQALLAQSQGQGANPAQAMLNQATDNNIKQNAGMIASQKGINPALAQRLAGQNAAAAGQQAAGQGAVMNAEQQVSAQQGLGNLYSQQANENLQNISTSGGLANNSSLGSQQLNAGTSAQNAAANQNTMGGIMNGAGAALAMLSKGGTVKKMADGGQVSASQSIANGILQAGGVPLWQSGNAAMAKQGAGMGGQLGSLMNGSGGGPMAMAGGPMDAGGGAGAAAMMAYKGGKIPPHLENIAKVYHPDFMNKKTTMLKSSGGPVPGKAKVSGNSPKNDTVPTMLSPGEIVLPRTVTQAKDPRKAAADFVAKELKKTGKYDEQGTEDEFKSALKKAIGSRTGK